MGNLWDEEAVSEYEMIAEDAEKAEELAQAFAAAPKMVEAAEEALEEIEEAAAFDLDKKESNVIYNARLRLEQAKLYEMLINHNLFEGVDASPDAIKNVQNELKFYIVKRLEVLLGLREPVVKIETAVAELPFNDIEIDFLKQLAYKGTLGASENGAPVTPKLEKQQIVKPLVAPKTPTPSKLKSLGTPKKKQEPVKEVETPTKEVRQPAKAALSVPKQAKLPAQPVAQKQPRKQAQQPNVKIRPSGMGREMTAQEAELIAREELKKNPPSKPFHEMSAKEKAAKIREVNSKYQRPTTNDKRAPMPTPQELEMKYLQQQERRSVSQNQKDQFNIVLANALAVQKNRGEDDE